MDKLISDISHALRSGQFAHAAALCERARRYAPNDARIGLLSATCELAAGRPDVAVGFFRTYLISDSQSLLARQGLIDALLQTDRAMEVFDDIGNWAGLIDQSAALKARFLVALQTLPYQFPVVAYSPAPHLVSGWICSRDPQLTAVELDISVEGTAPEKVTLDQLAPGLNSWSLPISLDDGCIQLGSTDCVILGNPIFLKPDIHKLPPPPKTRTVGLARLTRTVDVVVPVFKDREATLACIESVLAAAVETPFELVVIDDASPDQSLSRDLVTLAEQDKLTLIQHKHNVGFVRSVNAGMSLHPDRDVVLLNSDTLVYHGWLDGLVAMANSADKVATVTAFSNNATICSYPATQSINADISLTEHPKIAQTARLLSVAPVEIPTAVGSCMWVSRLSLLEIGLFDEAVFGKGYAEENDFCCRAVNAGWKNIAAPTVYVTHHGDRSFGLEKLARIKINLEKLNARHPGYDLTIQEFLAADPLRDVRRKLDIARLKDYQGAQLCITHLFGGGVERFLQERSVKMHHLGVAVFYLRVSASKGFVLEAANQPALFPNLHFTTEETDLLMETLGQLAPSLIEYHSLVDAPWELTRIPKTLALPYAVYLHDYSWLCHQVTLLQDGNYFCGGPHSASTCERCRTLYGSRMVTPDRSTLDWRGEAVAFLNNAREVVAPTQSTVAYYKKILRRLPISVVSHEENSYQLLPLVLSSDTTPVRIAVIGAIGDHKGYAMLGQLAKYAFVRQLPLEFVVIGFTKNDEAVVGIGNLHVTGPYDEAELPELCRKWGVKMALFLSPWPETWSYTFSEALQCGLTILAPKLGAFAERAQPGVHLFNPTDRVDTLARKLGKLACIPSSPTPQMSGAGKAPRVLKTTIKQPDIQISVGQPC